MTNEIEEMKFRCNNEDKNLRRSIDAKKSLNKALEQNQMMIHQKESRLKEMESKRDEM